VGRIIGSARETATAATQFAQEAYSPTASGAVVGITGSVTDLFANVAREPDRVFLIVVKDVIGGRAGPDPGSILREEL
jgi:hypothetical protein